MHQLLEHNYLVLDSLFLLFYFIRVLFNLLYFSEYLVTVEVLVLKLFLSILSSFLNFVFFLVFRLVQLHNGRIETFNLVCLSLNNICVLLHQHGVVHLRVADVTHSVRLFVNF